MPEGDIPNLIAPLPGCRFHPRCSQAVAICSGGGAEFREAAPGHRVACHPA